MHKRLWTHVFGLKKVCEHMFCDLTQVCEHMHCGTKQVCPHSLRYGFFFFDRLVKCLTFLYFSFKEMFLMFVLIQFAARKKDVVGPVIAARK